MYFFCEIHIHKSRFSFKTEKRNCLEYCIVCELRTLVHIPLFYLPESSQSFYFGICKEILSWNSEMLEKFRFALRWTTKRTISASTYIEYVKFRTFSWNFVLFLFVLSAVAHDGYSTSNLKGNIQFQRVLFQMWRKFESRHKVQILLFFTVFFDFFYILSWWNANRIKNENQYHYAHLTFCIMKSLLYCSKLRNFSLSLNKWIKGLHSRET